jgi:hypothetical protein
MTIENGNAEGGKEHLRLISSADLKALAKHGQSFARRQVC